MDHENNKQVIFVKDLLFAVLRRWRAIILVAVVFAIIAAAQAYVLVSSDSYKQTLEEVREDTARIQTRLTLKENAIAYQEDFWENSYQMSLDPYNVYHISFNFYVHSNYQIMPDMQYQDPDASTALIRAYDSILNDTSLRQEVSQAVGIDEKYAHQVFVHYTTATSDPAVLFVQVTHPDPDTATQVASIIETYLISFTDQLRDQLGEHRTSTTYISSGLTYDSALASSQRNSIDALNTLYDEKASLQKELNAASLSLQSASPVFRAVVGAVLGAMVVAVIAFFGHFGSKRVYSTRTLANHTGLKVITSIGTKRGKTFIDTFLRRMENRPNRTLSEQAELIAAHLSYSTSKGSTILLTGDCPASQIEAIAQALEGSGCQIRTAGSLLTDAQALHSLASCTAVVLVEQCNRSVYGNVSQQIDIIRDMDKPLLGCILWDI